MGDKFLGSGSNNINISNGTTTLFGSSIGAINLEPSQPLKTNSVRQLVSSKLDIADVNNLQSELNNLLTDPIILTDKVVPANPPAGQQKLYTSSVDNKLHILDSAGVDSVFTNGSFLPLAGGQMTGVIDMNSNQITNVSSVGGIGLDLSGKLDKSGGIMTGSLDLGNNDIDDVSNLYLASTTTPVIQSNFNTPVIASGILKANTIFGLNDVSGAGYGGLDFYDSDSVWTASNSGCNYNIHTTLDNAALPVERFKIASDNVTYITGTLNMKTADIDMKLHDIINVDLVDGVDVSLIPSQLDDKVNRDGTTLMLGNLQLNSNSITGVNNIDVATTSVSGNNAYLLDSKGVVNSLWAGSGAGATIQGTGVVGIGNSACANASSESVAVGSFALAANTANLNTAVGTNAFRFNTAGINNVAIGSFAYADATSTTGSSNVVVGSNAYRYGTGSCTVAVGSQAMGMSAASGDFNVCVGDLSGARLTTGGLNTLIGRDAGKYLTTATNNVVVGANNLDSVAEVANTSCIILGTGNTAVDLDNTTIIGTNITGVLDNQIVLGNSSITSIVNNGAICDLGTVTNEFKDLRLSGTAFVGGLTFPKPWFEMFVDNGNVSTTTGASTTTFVKVDYATTPATGFAQANVDNQSFTVDATTNRGRITYTGTVTKSFRCSATLSVYPTSNSNHEWEFALAKNGTVLRNSIVEITTTSAGDRYSGVSSSVVQLATNDYIELYVVNRTAGTRTITIHFVNIFGVALPNAV